MMEKTEQENVPQDTGVSRSILSANSIFKSYGSLNVLQNVSLTIAEGELVAITGQSGAGKSTLLHILGGLDKPDRGEVQIAGENIFGQPTKKLMRFRNSRIGFVFQFHHLLPEFTALENVCMPLWIKGTKKADAAKLAQEVLAQIGLNERLHHKPGALSGGEQQRVAIARALINRPAILFADEPTGNLDSETAGTIHQLFRDLQKQFQLTFVVVTHNEQFAGLADRELKMKDGMLLKDGMA